MGEIIGLVVEWIVDVVGSFGYLGIFVMMLLESSFVPFPSEVVMIPAGYLAYKGEMNIVFAIICGVAGSLAGALINYYLALKFGREFLIRFGKYFFFTESTMCKMEEFFAKHGHISTFVGRLITVVRQYISLPAGLSRMKLSLFCFYTSLGAGIWVIILTLIGYYIGVGFEAGFSVDAIIHAFTSKELNEQELQLKGLVKMAALYTLGFVIICVAVYVWYWRHKRAREQN